MAQTIFIPEKTDLDFGSDPYFDPKKVKCGPEHVKIMQRVAWPLIASYRKVLVSQGAMTTYTAIGMFAVGDADLHHFGAGHVLYVDKPGKGKSLLAGVPAIVLGGTASRFQGTSDNLPSDYLGNRIIDLDENEKRFFRLIKGPAFADIQLLDEINRNSPRTMSAFLEVIGEGGITIFNETHSVNPFVIFTMNPIETEGVYPILEALLDRIMFKITGDWFIAKEFAEIDDRASNFDVLSGSLKQVCGTATVREIREFFHKNIYVDPELKEKRMGLFAEISNSPHKFGCLEKLSAKFGSPIILGGLSGRGFRHWVGASKTMAAFRYREFVIPEDAQKTVLPVLRHRLFFAPGAVKFITEEFKLRDSDEAVDFIIKTLIKEAW